MLYILFAPGDRIKFAEYIPHLIIRAPNQKRAREFASAKYPSFPLPLLGDDGVRHMRCAPISRLLKLQSNEGAPGSKDFVEIYFSAEEGTDESEIRKTLSAVQWPNPLHALAILSPKATSISELKHSGKGGVLAKTENITPMYKQSIQNSLLYSWRAVSDQWPNPTKDPNLVPSDFMKPELLKVTDSRSFAEQEAELISRLVQPQ